ncbi:MAG: hypothetical protein WC046_07735 [Candidatus Bathyarchaeia archaeon]
MDRLALTLRILTVAILVVPLLGVACLYSDNLTGLIITPEIKNLVSGDISSSEFKLPVPAGTPTYDPSSGIYTFYFKVTNPLDNQITVSEITAETYCKNHNVALGTVSMSEPLTIEPGETIIVQASGTWTQQALEHFIVHHNGPEDDDINISFVNLNINLAGVSIHMALLDDAGWVMMPK